MGTEITDFKEDENLDENITYTLGSSYGYAITRELSLQLGINYERRVTERLSNGSNLASPQYYEETTAAFTVNYRPL